jgi:signal transduction histidine kinase
MANLKLQFTQEDIRKKFRELAALDEQVKESACKVFFHGIRSDAQRIFCSCSIPLMLPEFIQNPESQHKYQRIYLDSIVFASEIIALESRSIQRSILREKNLEMQGYNDSASNIFKKLEFMLDLYPITENVLLLGPLPKGERYTPEKINIEENILNHLQGADLGLELMIYTYNMEFSPLFKSEIYRLSGDIRYLNNLYAKKNNSLIQLRSAESDDIETKADYFTNVVLPIVRNIETHALNPENDIYNRLPTIKENPVDFYINTEVDEEKKQITVNVKDEGFGILPEVMEILFQQGATTRKDKEGHGIGLWAVKEFVEANGGTIWAETELGKKTLFSFTIPYKEKIKYTYIQ